MKYKSIWNDEYILSEDGKTVQRDIEKSIRKVLAKWHAKGFNPRDIHYLINNTGGLAAAFQILQDRADTHGNKKTIRKANNRKD